MDQQFIYLDGPSKIELCDLYDHKTRTFFHVKETWGSKSAYLFTQGKTSAEFFRHSADFRNKCKARWPKLFSRDTGQEKIVYGIAAPDSSKRTIPTRMTYFAKLSLYDAVTELKRLDYAVSIAPIRIINERK